MKIEIPKNNILGERHNKWVFILTLLVIVGAIVAAVIQKDSAAAWIQAGASFALILVTYLFIRVSQRALDESMASRVTSERSLDELITARMDSLRPTIALRYRLNDKNFGPVQGKCLSTYLINIGSGPAGEIELHSNLTFNREHSNYSANYMVSMKTWPTQDISFGVPLGTISIDYDTQIEFMVTSAKRQGGYTPITDSKIVILITYTDCYNRIFYTTQTDLKQRFGGPVNPDKLTLIKKELNLKAEEIASRNTAELETSF